MSEQIIQNLLTQVKAINKKYESIAEITGENFNIFRILGLASREVRTHSAFIGELLNPKGSHGQGAVFLQLFCEHLMLEQFDFTRAKVEIEKHVGAISADYTTGGFIDIIISDGKNSEIIIENKIYASDQPNQLLRYYNAFPNSRIYYLTLFGAAPSAESRGEKMIEGKNLFCISYHTDILKWLEKCREKAVSHPILRETITQYVYLIKYLTNQTINDDMGQEIKNILKENEDNFKIVKPLIDAYNSIKREIKEIFWTDLKTRMKEVNTKSEFEFKGDFIIHWNIDEDSDGFYLGFWVTQGKDKIDNKQAQFLPLSNLLLEINPKFKNNHNFIG